MSALAGKIALVTGASRGFGFATAAAMAAAGAHVVALARTVGGLEDLDDAIKAAGGEATLVPLDIRDDAGLARMGRAVFDRWGRLDLWLHTASFAPPLSPAEHIPDKDFDQVLAVDVRAFQQLIRNIDPLLRQAPAPLALICAEPSSARPFFGAHAAGKAAQSAMTQAWAIEAQKRITVVEVVPPAMPTALRGRFFPGEDRRPLTPIEAAADALMARIAGGGLAPGERIQLPPAPGRRTPQEKPPTEAGGR